MLERCAADFVGFGTVLVAVMMMMMTTYLDLISADLISATGNQFQNQYDVCASKFRDLISVYISAVIYPQDSLTMKLPPTSSNTDETPLRSRWLSIVLPEETKMLKLSLLAVYKPVLTKSNVGCRSFFVTRD